MALPKGTTIGMRYLYDNSAANTRNPAAPPVRVPWGQQSREEMGDLWLQVVTRTPAERQLLDETFRAQWMATDVVGLESLIRREPERAALRDDIAVLYMELNRPAEAVPHFEAALTLKKGTAPAHFNYGTALAGAGRLEEAVTQYRRALALRPAYAVAHNNLGTALLQLGRLEPALASFREAARLDPQLGEAHLNVGLVSRALRDFPEAVARFRRALELNPGWVIAISSLASVLAAAPDASVRNPTEAVRLAERAATLTLRRDANTLDVLAVAHAAAGDFDRAVAVADEALSLNPPAALRDMIRSHRAIFARREPYISAR
jgi:Tfp pilus assembly protein PilF